MIKTLLIISLLFSFTTLACQNPPVRTESDVINWQAEVIDYRVTNGNSIILDITFPLEFKGHPFTDIRLFRESFEDSNDFYFLLDSAHGPTISAMVGSEIINELVLHVGYSTCGYSFEYKISEHGQDGL